MRVCVWVSVVELMDTEWHSTLEKKSPVVSSLYYNLNLKKDDEGLYNINHVLKENLHHYPKYLMWKVSVKWGSPKLSSLDNTEVLQARNKD